MSKPKKERKTCINLLDALAYIEYELGFQDYYERTWAWLYGRYNVSNNTYFVLHLDDQTDDLKTFRQAFNIRKNGSILAKVSW